MLGRGQRAAERYFFLGVADLEKVEAKRRAHNRLGFAVQLTSVHYLGRFMPDPRQVWLHDRSGVFSWPHRGC
ncbi:DUF4158 domain-containing protein [Streptomyces sp. NPDC048483]|uniref:DUF4158 domain-containing protein n=1 Tax=Streptomyces sp. NPDC048483 TaxID=3154927 RepID=UPI003445C8E2